MNSQKSELSQSKLHRHLNRCENCKKTASFCYRNKSYNQIEVLKSFFFCGSYFCPVCANKKKGKLFKKFQHLKFSQHCRFLTLTLSTKDYSNEQALEKISYFFNLFVKLLRYRGYKFQYFKMLEFTKNNQVHIHALVSAYLDIRVVSLVWKSITGSYICDIRRPSNLKHTINYVLKYISKSLNYDTNKLFFLLHKRRYSYSQNFFLPTFPEQKFKQSWKYWNDESEFKFCVNHFFELYFDNFALMKFIFLN